jgi:hypothetical protein
MFFIVFGKDGYAVGTRQILNSSDRRTMTANSGAASLSGLMLMCNVRSDFTEIPATFGLAQSRLMLLWHLQKKVRWPRF